MIPSLGLVNLLQQLPELRETFYLLDYQFITKDIIQEQRDGRDAYSKVWEKGGDLPCSLGMRLSWHLHMFTNLGALRTPNPVLLGLYGGFIM